ncbi:4Fe-4S dicluster domain-containing protein [Candidatus Fermentibacteria bacterium]|nr:4Fe-4S dicluster domain-containing protein [Candidatus Fermentibacteria bacterium]
MIEQKRMSTTSLEALFQRYKTAGWWILAPRAEGDITTFGEVDSPGDVAAGLIQTTLSPKSAVLPIWEELFRFRRGESGIEVVEAAESSVPTIIFGLRPCDARAFAALDAVFTWDSQDEPYLARRNKVAFVSIACNQADDYCFCTSTGGGPGDTAGSDLLLTGVGDEYLVEVVTERGVELAGIAGELFGPAEGMDKAAHLASVPVRFDLDRLRQVLPKTFDREELWIDQSLRCLGCGACAYVCPTCVCFDIQDEATRHGGARVRCWDSCGFSLFTLHTSGHNPREVQSHRWRQRVMHKFAYMPERLQVLGCVGCGRCSRACPVDMNLAEHLAVIAESGE